MNDTGPSLAASLFHAIQQGIAYVSLRSCEFYHKVCSQLQQCVPYLIGNCFQLLSLGQGCLDAIMLNELCDQVAQHGLAVRGGPVQTPKVLAVMHVTWEMGGVVTERKEENATEKDG